MTTTELKKWLNGALYADKKMLALNMLIDQLQERALGISRNSDSNGRSESNGVQNGTENALLRLAEAIEQAEVQQQKSVSTIREIQKAISLLDDDDLESVLINRHLNYLSVEKTAEIMNYAPRTVRAKQKKAYEKLCKIMPCFAASDVVD